jgi:hypothetical protein
MRNNAEVTVATTIKLPRMFDFYKPNGNEAKPNGEIKNWTTNPQTSPPTPLPFPNLASLTHPTSHVACSTKTIFFCHVSFSILPRIH